MATKELPIKVEKDDTPQPFSKNFDQSGNSSGFIFDVSSVDRDCGRRQKRRESPKAQGTALAGDARQDESLLARGKLSLHRPDLPL